MVRLYRARHPRGSGDIIGCLAISMLSKRGAVGEREQSKDGNEKWIADSGATFHNTRSADLLRDLQPSEDKAKIGMIHCSALRVTGRGLSFFLTRKKG